MQIIAICPQCETRYQLDAAMRGKRTQCKNPWCRAIFEVREEAGPGPTAAPPEPAAPPSVKQVSGSVGEMIPILAAEQADPVPAPPTAAPAVRASVPRVAAEAVAPPRELPRKEPKPPWQEPPPVRKRPTTGAGSRTPQVQPCPCGPFLVPPKELAPTESRPQAPAPQVPAVDWGPLGEFFNDATAPAVSASNEPTAEAADTWEAPPIRGPGGVSADGLAGEPRALAPSPEPATRTTGRRRSWKVIAGITFVILLVGGAAALYWLDQRKKAGNEAERFEQAEQRYKDHSFEDAARRFQQAVRGFPGKSESSPVSLPWRS